MPLLCLKTVTLAKSVKSVRSLIRIVMFGAAIGGPIKNALS